MRSPTPADTKNTYFNGAEDALPSPGVGTALFKSVNTSPKLVSVSSASFWYGTVIRSMALAEVFAVDSFDASDCMVASPALFADAPKV
jgi:hypothetical protein